MGIVVVRSPKCLRGLLRRIFGGAISPERGKSSHTFCRSLIWCHKAGAAFRRPDTMIRRGQ